MTEERFWINEVNEELDGKRPVDGWFAVVDEHEGGEIAYFSTDAKALDYIEQLKAWGRTKNHV